MRTIKGAACHESPTLFRCAGTRVDNMGFTVVELLLCLAVISLLVAILLPAIQQSRESARTVQCKSNMHQIGLGMHNFHSVHQSLPPGPYPFVDLLPHVGYATLFEQIKPFAPRPKTQFSRRVTLYECPSDPFVEVNHPSQGLSSYLQCKGTYKGDVPDWNGVYAHGSQFAPTRFGNIRDGLSSTALVAESLLNASPPSSWTTHAAGQSLALESPRRFAWYTASTFRESEMEAFSQSCLDATQRVSAGPPFLMPHIGLYQNAHRGYDHVLPPNAISCANGPPPQPGEPYNSMARLSAVSASSLHAGCALILFCDGSVQTVSSSIDLSVWRAVGTMSEQDLVGEF